MESRIGIIPTESIEGGNGRSPLPQTGNVAPPGGRDRQADPRQFDPTIEPIQQLWKNRLNEAREPGPDEIAALLPATGWNKIHIEKGLFWKDHDGCSLDLGGIAKGYCVDLLVEQLNAAGYPDVFVEWGGEIRASGRHPDKRPWNIFISRLGNSNPSLAIATIALRDQAIATSGDYMQFWKSPFQKEGSASIFILSIRKLIGLSSRPLQALRAPASWRPPALLRMASPKWG